MPSSHSQQPPVTAKPRGIFLRKKIAEFGFGSSSKSGSSKGLMGIGTKNHSNESVNSTGNDGGNNDGSEPNTNSSGTSSVITPITTTITTSSIPLAANNKADKSSVTSNISNKVNNNSEPKSTNKNTSSDGNTRKSSFDSSTQESHMQTGHNGSFSAATRITNESSCASSSGEASSFMSASSSSSSSHRQRLHRQITTTSEMKTSCVKSDLTELKSSLSEMKNISFNTKLRKSIENILDGRENVSVNEDNGCASNMASGEPLITYPESPTPNSNTNIATFPCQSDAISSRKSSITTEESCCTSPSAASSTSSELKFEQRRVSSASKTKLITEQFKAEESSRNEMELKRLQSCDQFAYKEQIANAAVQTNLQTNNIISGKTLDAVHEQRTLAIGDLTQQQTQNLCSAKVRLQADSFSAEKIQKAGAQQQRQTITSSVTGGVFNKEKVITHSSSNFSSSKGFSTSVSHMQQFSNNSTNNFLQNEIDDAIQSSRQNSFADYMAESFDDLNKLLTCANSADVDKAIKKYTSSIEHVVKSVTEGNFNPKNIPMVLNKMSDMMTKAWLIPTHGHQLGNSLCNALRECGGLTLLISNCDSNDDDIKFSSAKLLEQCLTTENRAFVVENGLEKVVQVACSCTKNASTPDHSRVRTGILEHLFKHSEGTCEDVIRLGGLDAVLYECRKNDVETLRHCASALANLSLYGGADNQEAMIKRQVPVWLFPLAFHDDDNIKYYACLAIAALVANKEIEADVLKSGTLNLVEPFITSHNPSEFAKSNLSHAHGQSKNWLERLVPVLSSKREEARNLAAFHFCMEAGIKKSQGNTEVFREIGAIERLKQVASCPNAIASKFAAQALRLIGEVVPHKLIQQVPLWSVEDVKEWVMQIGFMDFSKNFEESRVDGDLLLRLTDENLRSDIGIVNGIRRQRFVRELQNLKKMADYSSRDSDNLNAFLQSIGNEFTVYTYSMLNAGVDKESIKSLTADQLLNECGIVNGIHRIRILDSIKTDNNFTNTFEQDSDKLLDVFISYRRSNGSQLASLLKVHLQLRKLTVFIDVEKLEAGKFDNNLLQSIKHAKNFLLVLTPNALDRCLGDVECKDWVHREIVAALQSHCKIIPITDNFEWPEPEKLPEDMRAICHFNGIRWIHDYQDACVDKIERFMRGEGGYRNDSGSEIYSGSGIHGTRLMKNESQIGCTSSTKSPPTYQRTHSSDSGKRSDDSLQD